jgi:uncharacterized membrane protein (UPF0136 family)
MSTTIANIAEVTAAATAVRAAALEPSGVTTGLQVADSPSSASLRDRVIISSNSKKRIAAVTIVIGFMLTLAWAGFLVWLAVHALGLW